MPLDDPELDEHGLRAIRSLHAIYDEDGDARQAIQARLRETNRDTMFPDGPRGRFFFLVGDGGPSIELVLSHEDLKRLVFAHATLSETKPGIRFSALIRIALEQEQKQAERMMKRSRGMTPH